MRNYCILRLNMLGKEELAIEDVLKFISSYTTTHPVIQQQKYMTNTCFSYARGGGGCDNMTKKKI